MLNIIIDEKLIANCGLYCGSCSSYLKEKCPGCSENVKASWCKVRQCCIESDFKSCADCQKVDTSDCKKLNNFISKIFSLLFNSDRNACIERIKEIGYEPYAAEMAQNNTHTLKKK